MTRVNRAAFSGRESPHQGQSLPSKLGPEAVELGVAGACFFSDARPIVVPASAGAVEGPHGGTVSPLGEEL